MAAKKLQGQVAIVTGAGRGIGAAAARLLAQAGASVLLTARTESELAAVAGEINAAGGQAIAVPADVGDIEHVEEVVESAVEQFGRIDILINNAAVIWPLERTVESDPDEWYYNIQVNLVAPYYLARNVLPLMIDQGYGRIINVVSAAAIYPIVGASAYCSAKAGLLHLTRVLAAELAGTRVSAIAFDPAEVDTEMQADIRSVDAEEVQVDTSYWHDAYAQGRLRNARDAGRALLWLAGPWGARDSAPADPYSLNDDIWRERVFADIP
jgi:NAD(P)-dependent dehydrogenase (short-subunit alcohol dehydrogenase family)